MTKVSRCEIVSSYRWSKTSQWQRQLPLREKRRLTSGVRLQISETDEGLVLPPIRRARPSAGQAGWRSLRGSAKGTEALKEHLAEHRREAKR